MFIFPFSKKIELKALRIQSKFKTMNVSDTFMYLKINIIKPKTSVLKCFSSQAN